MASDIIITTFVLAIVAAIIISRIRKRKNGQGSCSCGCSSCSEKCRRK